MWLLRSSPMEVRTLFWTKYWVGTLPLLAVSLPLIVVTNLLMDARPFILVLTTLTMVAVTFGVTAMALGLGALFPNYDTENVAEIPTSFGGLLFMMAAVLYLGAVVVLEAWPVYGFLSAGLQGGASPSVVPLVLGCAGAVLLTGLAIWLPLQTGMKRVQAGDIHDV